MVQIAPLALLSVALLAGQTLAAGAIIGRIAGGLASGVASGVISNNHKMRRVVRDSSASVISSTFSDCMNAVEESPVKHHIDADHTVFVTGLPPVCITEVNNYNALPNIEELNKVQGAVIVVNSTSIKVSGIPSVLSEYLESLGKH